MQWNVRTPVGNVNETGEARIVRRQAGVLRLRRRQTPLQLCDRRLVAAVGGVRRRVHPAVERLSQQPAQITQEVAPSTCGAWQLNA